MAFGGVMGMVAAFLQTLEKLTLLKNQHAVLTCDINSVFSCTNVLNSWQSSVFGFPNSLMCIVMFTIFAATALVGAMCGRITRSLRLGVQALAFAMLGFALWFLSQSIYRINNLCVLCIFCFAGLLIVNFGWLRINAADLPIGTRARKIVQSGITKGYDVLSWLLFAVIVLLAALEHFR